MKTRFVVALLIAIFYFQVVSSQTAIDDVKATTFTSLYLVYGWHKDSSNNKWSTKEKEIKGIDKFKSYSIASYTLRNKNYIAIIKLEEEGSIHTYNTYTIDAELYKEEITKWDKKTVLRFPIINHTTLKKKKSLNISFDEFILGAMENKYTSTPYFVIQYKFDIDDVVKFIFYIDHQNTIGGLNGGRITTDDLGLLGTDKLYNNFFYKTTYDAFTKFTDSPL